METLTPRQEQVAQLIAEGFATKEIAAKLGISYKTADHIRTRMMRKIKAHNVVDVTRYVIRAEQSPPLERVHGGSAWKFGVRGQVFASVGLQGTPFEVARHLRDLAAEILGERTRPPEVTLFHWVIRPFGFSNVRVVDQDSVSFRA